MGEYCSFMFLSAKQSFSFGKLALTIKGKQYNIHITMRLITKENKAKHAHLTEHLEELRTRLFRSLAYICAGTIAAWFLYDQIFWLITRPMIPVMKNLDTKFLLTNFVEPFMIRMQVCLVSGLVIACPLVIMEAWGFVSPGLNNNEKRPMKWMAPLSAFLFIAGVVLCYKIMPIGFEWFAYYIPKNAELRPDVQNSIAFMVKMLLVFGILFQVPIVIMILSHIGIIDSRMLKNNWRIAVVLASIVAAVATPSNDALTMIIAAVPVIILYFLGIFLVQLTERSSIKQRL